METVQRAFVFPMMDTTIILPWPLSARSLTSTYCYISTMSFAGADLLAKLKVLANASKSDLVLAADYVSTTKDGTERLNFTAFYEAHLPAKGISVGKGSGPGKG
jgi:hypothetical protein